MQTALSGSNSTAALELVSMDRGTFSSTAHYRLKGEGEIFGGESVELLFVDRIEHGPLPFSRLITLKWLPVMATSHTALERNPLTDKWFAATKDQSPLKGVVNLGYDESINGTYELLPLETKLDEQSQLTFSGLKIDVAASAQGQKVKAYGYMDSFKLTTVAEDQTPVQVELNGLTLASNLSKSTYGYYMGDNTLLMSSTKATFGEPKSVLGLKNFEMKNSSSENGTSASGRADYKIGELSFNDKTIGSAQMAVSLKNLDIPATMSLMQIYQTKLQPYEKAAAEAAAAGEPAPELSLTEAEEAQVKADLEKLLAGAPQVALENLSFNTANGESRASLIVDLAKPQSMDLPPDELGRQLLALLDFNLKVSKPMLVDLMTVQAQMEGQTDAKLIADTPDREGDRPSTCLPRRIPSRHRQTPHHRPVFYSPHNGRPTELSADTVAAVLERAATTDAPNAPRYPITSTATCCARPRPWTSTSRASRCRSSCVSSAMRTPPPQRRSTPSRPWT